MLVANGAVMKMTSAYSADHGYVKILGAKGANGARGGKKSDSKKMGGKINLIGSFPAANKVRGATPMKKLYVTMLLFLGLFVGCQGQTVTGEFVNLTEYSSERPSASPSEHPTLSYNKEEEEGTEFPTMAPAYDGNDGGEPTTTQFPTMAPAYNGDNGGEPTTTPELTTTNVPTPSAGIDSIVGPPGPTQLQPKQQCHISQGTRNVLAGPCGTFPRIGVSGNNRMVYYTGWKEGGPSCSDGVKWAMVKWPKDGLGVAYIASNHLSDEYVNEDNVLVLSGPCLSYPPLGRVDFGDEVTYMNWEKTNQAACNSGIQWAQIQFRRDSESGGKSGKAKAVSATTGIGYVDSSKFKPCPPTRRPTPRPTRRPTTPLDEEGGENNFYSGDFDASKPETPHDEMIEEEGENFVV